jgi:hypothetical protein
MEKPKAFNPVKWVSDHLNVKFPFVGFKSTTSNDLVDNEWVKVCSYEWKDKTMFEGVGPNHEIAKTALSLVILGNCFPTTFSEHSEDIKRQFQVELHHVQVSLEQGLLLMNCHFHEHTPLLAENEPSTSRSSEEFRPRYDP